MDLRPITPTRLQVKGWARVGPAGAHTLRRGAWYPVVRISSSNIVVLDVNRHNVPVDRRVMEKLGRVIPLTYAVCPSCRHRQGFQAGSNEMTCDRCKKVAGLAWDELS